MTSPGLSSVALLLLGSGFAALAYQQVWFRLFREVFGASTPATAAVMAIFMAGLGVGGLLLGRRADASRNPLRLYGLLELGVVGSAAVSPFLISVVQGAYLATGGSHGLGPTVATLARLVLAGFVLGLPTFLMGGTLPAATRAVEVTGDHARRRLGVLYGANTTGAVLGTLWATFLAFEYLGMRHTLWVAAAVNLVMALVALGLSTRGSDGGAAESASVSSPEPVEEPAAPAFLVLAAAALMGFAFFLMELVWYRMLAPLLGGSSYTFGLILAVALAGIGAGGFVYGRRSEDRRPGLMFFAVTCAVEALFTAIPFAAGDHLALLAQTLRGLQTLGYWGLVSSWTAVTLLVVFLPAFVAGYQFPLLVALLGRGRRGVGRQVGQAYAWNTLGSIAGSLAGGFGLLPLLGAPGLWRGVTVLLVAVAGLAFVQALRQGGSRRAGGAVFLLALLAMTAAMASGPSALWRHTGIGAGRWSHDLQTENDWRSLRHAINRSVTWEADGIETSLAVTGTNGYAFVISGKVDGHAIGDAPTQVGAPLVGAMLHPDPKRAFIVGLGTGSSAGWLAAVPGMEEVRVAELEPAMDHVADLCAPVNHDALGDERVQLSHGDGRELLLAAPGRFDIIFSEPSNPYRAGIASLYTEDFYRLAAEKLDEGGLFLQWVQAYAVGTETIASIYATLGRVFPVVETWELAQDADLLLVASKGPIRHDLHRVQRRAAGEPYRTWLERILGVAGAGGFYAGHIATPAIAGQLMALPVARVNTDDRPVVEFQFVRTLGRSRAFSVRALAAAAESRDQDLPAEIAGSHRPAVRELRALRAARQNKEPPLPTAPVTGAARLRTTARSAWLAGDMEAVVGAWTSQDQPPAGPFDQWMLAEALAHLGSEEAPALIEEVADTAPGLGSALLARWHAVRGERGHARRALLEFVPALRADPWLPEGPLRRSLELAARLAGEDPAWDRAMFEALAAPFVVERLQEQRLRTRMRLAAGQGTGAVCLHVLDDWEPWVPWTEPFLTYRYACYAAHDSPRAPAALHDLTRFRQASALPLELPDPG